MDTDIFSDHQIVAKTVYGEARGEGLIGQQAVINVIFNRTNSPVTWWGVTPRSVCLKPYQFSCWNKEDPNRNIIIAVNSLENEIFKEIAGIVLKAFEKNLPDITEGADSYKTAKCFPNWAKNLTPVKIIGHHEFYKTI